MTLTPFLGKCILGCMHSCICKKLRIKRKKNDSDSQPMYVDLFPLTQLWPAAHQLKLTASVLLSPVQLSPFHWRSRDVSRSPVQIIDHGPPTLPVLEQVGSSLSTASLGLSSPPIHLGAMHGTQVSHHPLGTVSCSK